MIHFRKERFHRDKSPLLPFTQKCEIHANRMCDSYLLNSRWTWTKPTQDTHSPALEGTSLSLLLLLHQGCRRPHCLHYLLSPGGVEMLLWAPQRKCVQFVQTDVTQSRNYRLLSLSRHLWIFYSLFLKKYVYLFPSCLISTVWEWDESQYNNNNNKISGYHGITKLSQLSLLVTFKWFFLVKHTLYYKSPQKYYILTDII